MRLLSNVILAILLLSTSFNLCVLEPVTESNETKIAIDVCNNNKSIIAHSVDNALVEERALMVSLEKQSISYIPVVFSLITYTPEPPEKPPR